MGNGHVFDAPALAYLLFDLGELVVRHGPVGLVLQVEHVAALRAVASRPKEGHDRAVGTAPDARRYLLRVQGANANLDHRRLR